MNGQAGPTCGLMVAYENRASELTATCVTSTPMFPMLRSTIDNIGIGYRAAGVVGENLSILVEIAPCP